MKFLDNLTSGSRWLVGMALGAAAALFLYAAMLVAAWMEVML